MNRQDELEVTLALSPVNTRLQRNLLAASRDRCSVGVDWHDFTEVSRATSGFYQQKHQCTSPQHQIFSVERHTSVKEHHRSLLQTSTPSTPVTCSFSNTKTSGFRVLTGNVP